MRATRIIWDDTPQGNVRHIEEHGLEPEEVDYVLEHSESAGRSRSSGLPCVFGYTPDGRDIIVIYEEIDEDTVMPLTAYEVPESH